MLGKEYAWHSESALTSAAIEKLPFGNYCARPSFTLEDGPPASLGPTEPENAVGDILSDPDPLLLARAERGLGPEKVGSAHLQPALRLSLNLPRCHHNRGHHPVMR